MKFWPKIVIFCAEICLLRYAALYFVLAIDPNDNALLAMDIIQRYVELLDKYFKNVSRVLVKLWNTQHFLAYKNCNRNFLVLKILK